MQFEWNQSILKGGQRYPRALANRVARVFTAMVPGKRRMQISVSFVDRATMQRLNKKYRGKNRPTDVLSFCLSDETTSGRRNIEGEILFLYEQAKRQAKERSHTTREEITFLLVHGLLHVVGYDHETPRDRARMFPLQTRIAKKLGIDPRVE